ncbi:S9 family peptidase [bacterium]|nr:S9 family peptidase [bacterium]
MSTRKQVARGAMLLALSAPSLGQPQAPKAKIVPHLTNIHGQELVDHYFWLRDRNDPDTLAYLKAENAYCDKLMNPTRPLQKKLYQEMLSRVQEDDQRAPYRIGKYGYFARSKKGKSYPIYCRVPWGKEKPVEVLLDANALAKGHDYLGVGSFEISPDSNWLAYSLDLTGYRQYRLHFKDLRSKTETSDSLERVTSVCWAQDNKTIFYTTEDPVTKRSDKFWRHTIGSNETELLYTEKDELFEVACAPSRDQSMVLLHCYSKTSTEMHFRPADASRAALKLVRPREADHEYWGDFYAGRFIIRTNQRAPMFKLVSATASRPEQWSDLVTLPEGTQVDQFCLFPEHIALSVRSAGVPGLALTDTEGKNLREVQFKESVRSLTLGENEDPDLNYVRVEYESPVTPPTTYDVHLKSGALRKVRQQPVPNYNSRLYRCQRWMVKARDGVLVPVTLVYRAGTRPDKSHPLYMEGYGSYGSIDDPYFSSSLVSLLDRGVVYAYAHIRGGGEMGEPWRMAGRMMQKMNTFNDFVDCGQNLVDSGWSRANGLVITGGSAGGLLVGAAVNQRPELFKAAVCKVPFVDVMNTMLDASLPLTTGEYIEWGNPNEKSAFDYMMKYSPYDNIQAKDYPSMLVKVSLNDSQVPYWEGAKFVAKMRALKTDQHPLLLKSNLKAGHGGSSGRYDRLKERAFDYAYVLWQMGLLQN